MHFQVNYCNNGIIDDSHVNGSHILLICISSDQLVAGPDLLQNLVGVLRCITQCINLLNSMSSR